MCDFTRDLNIHRRQHELELYRRYNVGMFFFKGASKKHGMSVWEMVQALVKNWTEIPSSDHPQRKTPFCIRNRFKTQDTKIVTLPY